MGSNESKKRGAKNLSEKRKQEKLLGERSFKFF